MRKHGMVTGTLAALVLALVTVPAGAARQDPEIEKSIEQELARAQAAVVAAQQRLAAQLAQTFERQQRELRERHIATQARIAQAVARAQERARTAVRAQEPFVYWSDSESGWLGVSIQDVTAEKAKELKLPAERGVYVSEVDENSPAAKAGLKSGDVILEFNGQRVEGAVQFRRMVQETPAGRSVQLSVWRDGRTQNLSAQLSSRREQIESRVRVLAPDIDFNIRIPEILVGARTPALGVSVDDLSGQLGEYFGAPDGKGVLVREVRSGSPAEKAGLKAGDVIVKVDGDRVENSSDLRSKLRDKREQKTVRLTVLRKGAEIAVNVEIEPPRPAPASITRRRTTL
jgi:serine protease Do